MKAKFLLIALLVLGSSMIFTSCVYEEPVIVYQQPRVAVDFDFWTGSRHVEIDGSVLNQGNVDVRSVNIEFLLIDRYGDVVSSSWHQYRVNLLPREEFFFSIDIGEFGIYEVRLGRVEADGFY